MKKQPTGNKTDKYKEEEFLTQKDHKDKERRELIDEFYKGHKIPKAGNRVVPSPKKEK